MGSGKTISAAGPSVIFVYMIIGFMLFFVMRAMGELLLSNLHYKSFSDFAADLLGPAGVRLATPEDPESRGAHLTLEHPGFRAPQRGEDP